MSRSFFLGGLLIFGISTSLFAYSFCLAISANPLFLIEAIAQQDTESLISVSQESGSEEQQGQGTEMGGAPEQCPQNQHNVGSTNQCEWDNCGSATPPMYRNTQTGRCVSDCSEVGQTWVKQGNICVPGKVTNATSTESPPTVSSVPPQGNISGNGTAQSESVNNLPTSNVTVSAESSNDTSGPSTISQSIAGLSGEPSLPYACFSSSFTCYCDGTEDCKQLTSSGECKAEVRTVEGKPGLGECNWNANQ
jgi:hypothetical protein